MDEPSNTSNNEVDLSDSWTIVNSDDSEVNAEAEETSDSESLEVLEVEQETSERNCQDDLESSVLKQNANVCSEGEENNCEEYSEDCHDSFLHEDPLIHLAAIQKVRKYVHHPSAYINMWLSVVMVIAIAVTLGLGIGHYLGSKRFARAKDIIHHLKYENQLLEQELADVTVKNKHCESDLLSRVRHLEVELNQSELSDSYCRSYYFQDMYANLMHGHDEDVCYAEENPLFTNLLKHSLVNDTLPPFLHWISYISDSEQVMDYPFENEFTINGSYINKKNSDNTLFDVEFLPKLEVINDQMHSNTSHFQFSKLNTHLTYLISLLKKWNEFRGNLKLPASDSKTGLAGLQNTEHLSEVAHKVVPAVSGSPYKVLDENVKSRLPNSSNDFCRLNQINQCILHEKRQKKEKKCHALTKAQLLCSLLQRSKKKQRNNFMLRKQKVYSKKDKKSEVSQFSFEQNRYRKVEKAKFTNEKNKSKGENGKLGTKVLNYSESGSKRMKKKDKVENSAKKVGSKEKNNKFKRTTKNQNIGKKEKKQNQSEKQYDNLQGQKKQLSKPITKNKQLKKYETKENIKNKGKQHINWDKNKIKYKGKFPNSEKINRKNAENLFLCFNDQRQCKFLKNYKKLTENRKRVTYSRNGYSKKSYRNYEKLSGTKNANKNTIPNMKKCSSVEGHRKFNSKDKRISDKNYKFAFSEKSYKFKTQSNEMKNDSENSSCKYSFLTHKKDENFPKYLKERGKIYDLHMQEMNVFKT